MKELTNYMVGSDIEFFVRSPEGEIISAEGLIKGTKHEPYHYSDDPYFATQLDNVLCEGNIPPARTPEEFYEHILSLRGAMERQLPKGHRTVACASAELHERFLTAQARHYGCDPSYNAWDGTEIPPHLPEKFIRSAGFHIHIGYDDPDSERNRFLVKLLDVWLGLPTALYEPLSERHKLGYGLAGNFRHQKHGVEYRTLSTWWASEPRTLRYVAQNTFAAIRQYNSWTKWGDDKQRGNFFNANARAIQEVINDRRKNTARSYMNHFGVPELGE